MWQSFDTPVYSNIYHFCYIVGTVSEFKKKFENPILRGRDADASDADHKKGAEKLAEVKPTLLLPYLTDLHVPSYLPTD